MRRKRRPPGCRVEPLESDPGFRLSGELDLTSVDAVRSVLEPELQGTLVLDLAGLEFIDDSGLGLLLWTFRRVRERSGSLVLRHPQGQILRVLEMTGIERVPGLRIELAPAQPDTR